MSDDDYRARIRRSRRPTPEGESSPNGAASFLGKIKTIAANRAALQFFIVNPVAVAGTESEGGAPVLTVDTTLDIPVLALRKPPSTDPAYAICTRVDYRWVSRGFDGHGCPGSLCADITVFCKQDTSVTLVLTKPGGATDTQTVTPDSGGKATYCWPGLPAGSYTIAASATHSQPCSKTVTYAGDCTPVQVPITLVPLTYTVGCAFSACWDDPADFSVDVLDAFGSSGTATPTIYLPGSVGTTTKNFEAFFTLPWPACTLPLWGLTFTVTALGIPIVGKVISAAGGGCVSASSGNWNTSLVSLSPAAGYVCSCCSGRPRVIRDTLDYSDDQGSCTVHLVSGCTIGYASYVGNYSFTCPTAAIIDPYGNCTVGPGTVNVTVEYLCNGTSTPIVRKYVQIKPFGWGACTFKPIAGAAAPGICTPYYMEGPGTYDCSGAPSFSASGTFTCFTGPSHTFAPTSIYCPSDPIWGSFIPPCLSGNWTVTGTA